MPDAFFERLRADLRPKYELLSEIGSGGMGAVYLAEHVELRRRVAIKVIRPELANARAIERFRREGRALALVDHPGVIRVYDTGTTPSGIHYLEMEFAEGETLEARLERERPLSPGEVTHLAVKLLQALDKVHQAGIIHRDLKPSNILLAKDDGHPILIDFGIAKADRAEDESLTEFRERVGTLRYMAPEQREGKDATPRTDIYALGVVLYEAATGKDWPWAGSEDVEWSGIPSPLREAIQTAMASRPQARWQSALEFTAAIEEGAPVTRTTGAPLPSRLPSSTAVPWGRLAAVVLLLLGTAIWYRWISHRPPSPDFALLPFTAAASTAPVQARDLAWNVGLDLEGLQLTLVDPLYSFRCASGSREPPNTGQWRKDCGSPARFRAEGTVELRGDSLRVQLRVFDKADALKLDSLLAEPADSSQLLAGRIALAIAHVKYPDIQPLDPHHPNLPAWAEFLKGEAAFVANEWVNADQHYQTALQLDSTFAYAAWRLAVVRAWMRVPVRVNLEEIFRRYGKQLPQTIRYQVRATLAPIGPLRVALLDSAVRAAPFDASARLLYGDELWGRGPLVGIGLDSAARVLESATRLAAKLLPAYADLDWIYIRLGERDSAQRVLDTLVASAPAREATGIDIPGLFQVIYGARFPGGRAPEGPLDTAGLERSVRFGLAFDIPEVQLKFGRLFAQLPGATGGGANGHEAVALALLMMGRVREALAQFDTAAQGFGTGIEAAEWRALPGALGWPVIPPEEAARGEATLEEWTRDTRFGGRALADLAWIALTRGDSVAAGVRLKALEARLKGDSSVSQPLGLLEAVREALGGKGGAAGALRHSQALLTAWQDTRTHYPFLRSMLHLARAGWLEQLDSVAAAEREWLWYENNDATEWPTGPAQAGDVDWTLANYARLRRTLVALRAAKGKGGTARACRHLDRVAELWAEADSAPRALLDSMRRRAPACKP